MSITPSIFFLFEILDLRFVPAIDNITVISKKENEILIVCCYTSLHIRFFFIPEFFCYCLRCVYGFYKLMVVCMAFISQWAFIC